MGEKRVRSVAEEVRETEIERVYRGKILSHFKFIENWFEEPDYRSLKITYAACTVHGEIVKEYYQDLPLFLFLVGLSGSGKTVLGIEPLNALPNTEVIENLTINSFISGYGENTGILGKLTKLNKGNGILLFPDFTSILNKRSDEIAKITGELRHIADGAHSKHVGNKQKEPRWEGKVTAIAACTPAIEEYWNRYSDLGERFMMCRWHSPDQKKVLKRALSMMGHTREVKAKLKSNIKDLFVPDMPAILDDRIDWEENGIEALALIVAKSRAKVEREWGTSSQAVSRVNEPEVATRIVIALKNVARGWASFCRRTYINSEDIVLARKLAFDSIPESRAKVIKMLLQNPVTELSTTDVRKALGMPKKSFYRTVEEMGFLSLVKLDRERHTIHLTDEFGDMLSEAKLA